jgi:Domain of unknown function (DUF1707)
MAGPGDELAAGAGGRGHLRASHADREQVIYTLKVAFVQGMIDKDDFDLRVGRTFASRTYTELAAVISDIPAAVRTARPPAPSPAPGEQPVVRPGPVLAAATAAYGGLWGYVLLLSPHGGDNPSAPPLIFLGGLVYWGVLLICLTAMVALRREKRSSGQPPRQAGPGAGGRVFPDQGRRLPPGHDGHTRSTHAARRRVSAVPVRGLCGEGSLAACAFSSLPTAGRSCLGLY